MKNFNFIDKNAKIYGTIGNFNSIGDASQIGEKSLIGNCCNIGNNVRIIYAELGDFNKIENNVKIGANVVIKNCCHLGFGITVGKNVKIGNNVSIECDIPDGCIIGNNVTIKKSVVLGKNNIIHDNCVLRGNTLIGNYNEFLPGCIIGFWPKDIGDHHYEGCLKIGDNNFFGENTIINVGEKTDKGDVTKIGNGIYSMDKVTINHNDQIAVGNEIPDSPRAFTTIISSGVSLAGHVEVGKGANLGMQTVAHQFSKIGAGAMIGMNANITKNVPPFAKVIATKVVGYNKRPLAENLGFGTYEDEYLELVGYMLETACKSENAEDAIDKLQKYKGRGQWYDKALEVIVNFLESDQNGRELMKCRT